MKVLWAVDIMESHPKAIDTALRFITALDLMSPAKVDVVTVIYPADSRPSVAFREKQMSLLQVRVGLASKKRWFNSKHVLFESQISQRVAVLDLIEFAKMGNYDAIIAVKHSRTGLKKSFLGSFAEMLAFLSPLPIFLVNPDGPIPRRIRSVRFATDGEPECGKDFRKLSQLIPLTKATVRLHHRIPFVFPNRISAKDQDAYRQTETRRVMGNCEAVSKLSKKLGIDLEMQIIQESAAPAESILAQARQDNDDLIILVHRRKGALGLFLGRTTKRVMRDADRPVLLFRA